MTFIRSFIDGTTALCWVWSLLQHQTRRYVELPIIVSLSSVVAIIMKQAYLGEFLETYICYSFQY
jgi:hypothetical protein